MTIAYPLHPAAEIFPAMDEAAFAALVADIAAHGQREPILILDGRVIDGRHRQRACRQLGIEPLVRQLSADDGDPFALVVSLNLHRRHLSESQRAMVAARLASLGRGRPSASRPLAGLTQPHAAQLLNVGERSLQRARVVLEHGMPELGAAVESGAIPVRLAAQLAQLPASQQRLMLTKSPQEIRDIAREVQTRIEQAGVCGASAVRIFERVVAEQQLCGADQMAVVEAIKAEQTPLPSPSEARRLAEQSRSLVLGSDGRFHGATVCAESTADAERWLALREGLESLCRIDVDAQSLMGCVPHYQKKNLSGWLSRVMPLITAFDLLWKEARHA